MDREIVMKGLECHKRAMYGEMDEHGFACDSCPYKDMDYTCRSRTEGKLIEDALALLKKSFTPQEVYDTVIEHAQHEKRFKLGDKIDYSFTDVVDILNIELMCKAGDM